MIGDLGLDQAKFLQGFHPAKSDRIPILGETAGDCSQCVAVDQGRQLVLNANNAWGCRP